MEKLTDELDVLTGKLKFLDNSIRVVRKLQFPQAKHGLANFRLKTQNAAHFARTWATTNRVGEQAR
ncbi:MAG: hypothetical protein LBC27_05385 [Spirochaetaceae bacterium]|jgi:hypothetical protein|nr:hypothetical protein [Spirochaetaceae bacterium]